MSKTYENVKDKNVKRFSGNAKKCSQKENKWQTNWRELSDIKSQMSGLVENSPVIFINVKYIKKIKTMKTTEIIS